MSKIDWSKPIELYDKTSGATHADAEVLASDLKGRWPYVVRWAVPKFPNSERVDMCTEAGSLFWRDWRIRNKKVVHHKLLIVAIRSNGEVHHFLRDTREAAEKDLRSMLETVMYVAGQVVEIEWTEE